MSGSKESFGGGGGGRLVGVSRSRRCPICGSERRCSIRSDGVLVICRTTAEGAVKTAQDGSYVHILDSSSDATHDRSSARDDGPTLQDGAPRSSIEVIDKAYRLWLSELTLSPEHRQALLLRGFTDAQIRTNSYRTYPRHGRFDLAKKLVERLGEADARGVPGLFVATREDTSTYWMVGGWSGMLVPQRNLAGQIVALKVRRDDADLGPDDEKYLYITSSGKDRGGASAISSVHVPIGGEFPIDGALEGIIRITEGELKADAATVLSHTPTISIPGVAVWNRVLPILDASPGVTQVLVAFDADHATKPIDKPGIAIALLDLCAALDDRRKSLRWALELWEPALGKGIDDVFNNGWEPRVVDGAEAKAYLATIAAKYRPIPMPSAVPVPSQTPPPKLTKVEAKEAQKKEDRAKLQEKQQALSNRIKEEIKWERSGAPPSKAPSLSTEFALGDGHEIARRLMATLEYGCKARIIYDEGEFYRYSNELGIWEPLYEEQLFFQVGEFSGCPVGAEEKLLTIDHATSSGAIKLASYYRKRRGFFARAPIGIAFTNGYVTVQRGVINIAPHSPDHRARHRMGFAYQKDAPRVEWIKFLDSVFTMPGETEALRHPKYTRDVDRNEYRIHQSNSLDREAKKALLQEFIGACLAGEATRYQRALVLIGEGANGKSVFISVVKALFPDDAVTEVNPHDWGDKDLLAELAGKRLNAVNEMPENELKDTHVIKSVITGNSKQVHRKYERAFKLSPIAGHLLSCNGLPTTKDQSKGFWRRFLVVRWDRDFETDPKRINGLEEILASPENLPGIAAWALEGAARMQEQKAYTVPSSSVFTMEDWRVESDQVRQWAEDCTRTPEQDQRVRDAAEKAKIADLSIRIPPKYETAEYDTSSTLAYHSYSVWARENGHLQPLTAAKFYRRLNKLTVTKIPHHDHNAYAFRIEDRSVRPRAARSTAAPYGQN